MIDATGQTAARLSSVAVPERLGESRIILRVARKQKNRPVTEHALSPAGNSLSSRGGVAPPRRSVNKLHREAPADAVDPVTACQQA